MWSLAAMCVLAVVACGNRLPHDEVLAQNVTDRAPVAATHATGGATGADGGAVDVGPGDAAGAGQEAGGTGGSTSVGASASGASASANRGAGAAVAASKAPLVIGMVGWLSGLGGLTQGYARDALVAWSKSVNAKGGINGHPVQLYVADDGGNEARSVSIVRDFVENKGVIALVYYAGGSAVGVGNYAKSKNIPIVGGLEIEQLWTQNPMMFPTQPATDGQFWGIAKLAVQNGAKKAATVFCTEAAACQSTNDRFVAHAKELGLPVVYQGRISFTQPDYTADCLQMRNAGVDTVVPITENTSLVRLAQSCARQQFKPTYMIAAGSDAMAGQPVFDGAIGGLASFPWFLRGGHPGIDEYTAALQKYAPDRLTAGVDTQSAAWVAGKMFERAAAKVSDKPTSQEILDGLWSMKDESLGGLLAGGLARTFTRGQPTPETFCAYYVRITGGKWTAPQGITPVCK